MRLRCRTIEDKSEAKGVVSALVLPKRKDVVASDSGRF